MLINTVMDCIGNTPLISIEKSLNAKIFAKAEFLNPGGSIKDRIAKYMIEEAEKRGELKLGMTIIEPTSGNTGIGLTLVGTLKGYRVIIVMPENMSDERKKIITALGGELVLTPAEESLDGCLRKIKELQKVYQNVFIPQQFDNYDNPMSHYLTTAQEIVKDLNRPIDIFVSGLGSGGTLAGIGRFLKEKYPNIKIVAVEPKNVSALLGHEPGLHKIQGIGDGFIPAVLNPELIDEVVEVTDDDAIEMARFLAKNEALLVGTSAGANVWAAKQMALKYGAEKVITTILPDRAERYFSTALI